MRRALLAAFGLLALPLAAAAAEANGYFCNFTFEQDGRPETVTLIVIDFPEPLAGCTGELPPGAVAVREADGGPVPVRSARCTGVELGGKEFGRISVAAGPGLDPKATYTVTLGPSFPVEAWRGREVLVRSEEMADPLPENRLKIDLRSLPAGETAGPAALGVDFDFGLARTWKADPVEMVLGIGGQGTVVLNQDSPTLDSLTLDPVSFGLRRTPDFAEHQYWSSQLDLHGRIYATQDFAEKQYAAGLGYGFALLDPAWGRLLQETVGLMDLAGPRRAVRFPAVYLGYDYVLDQELDDANERIDKGSINRVTGELAWSLPVGPEGFFLDVTGRGFWDIVDDPDEIDQDYRLYGQVQLSLVRYLDDDVKVLLRYTDGRLPPRLTPQTSWDIGFGLEF